jgi:hypothetical protein
MARIHLCIPLAAAALALALGGCGAQQDSAGEDFEGAEAEVAQVVDDLQSAAQRGDAEELCSRILSPELAGGLADGGSQCIDEMEKAVGDVNDFDLEVTGVSISGATARAEVTQGEDGKAATFELAREGRDWRVTSLAG